MKFFKPFLISIAIFSTCNVFAEDAYQEMLTHDEFSLNDTTSNDSSLSKNHPDLSTSGSGAYKDITQHNQQEHGSVSLTPHTFRSTPGKHQDSDYNTGATGDA